MGLKWLISWLTTFPIFILLTGVEIKGKIPKKGPLIIASNHLSFLDPPLIGYTAFREIFFLAKPGLFTISKFFTWLIKTYNAINLEAGQGLRPAIKLLKSGRAVVIFPEGTRSRKGVLLPFNPGVGFLAINYNVPVVPVRIINSNKNWLTLILRWHKLKIVYGKPVYPDGFKNTKADYERFATKIREEVSRLK
ncbi:MAG: 1-acyl-sn-glycerol-3-phosphate acyltransferase [candidate division WOR-3 bacterium]|nr:1-acyl-sn-glycerol-3-phosphate acyltransferase [candidate division WOR-3 bacterium]